MDIDGNDKKVYLKRKDKVLVCIHVTYINGRYDDVMATNSINASLSPIDKSICIHKELDIYIRSTNIRPEVRAGLG